jgi:hypothetical protein
MAEPTNIYAPPAEGRELPISVSTHGDGVWRERGLAVAPRSGAIFPPRCVVCNLPGAERLQVTLRWHPEWVYAFTVLGVLPYFLLVAVLGKTAPVELCLCPLHAQRRRTGLSATYLGIPASLGIAAFGVWAEVEGIVYVGLSGLLAGILFGLLWGRIVHIGRMDDRFVSLAVGRPFLESLPSRDGWGAPQGGYPGHPTPPGQWGPPPQGGSAAPPGQWGSPPQGGSAAPPGQWGSPPQGGYPGSAAPPDPWSPPRQGGT